MRLHRKRGAGWLRDFRADAVLVRLCVSRQQSGQRSEERRTGRSKYGASVSFRRDGFKLFCKLNRTNLLDRWLGLDGGAGTGVGDRGCFKILHFVNLSALGGERS